MSARDDSRPRYSRNSGTAGKPPIPFDFGSKLDGQKSGDVFCSVVIPTFNGAATISACLESILHQDLSQTFEVIVVDSSTDTTPDIIRRDFPKVKLIHHERQVPEGEARNIGVDCARGEFIAMTDQDCVVPPDWLAGLAKRLQSSGVAAVGGSIAPSNGDGWFTRAAFLAEFSGFLSADAPEIRRSVPTCNIAYRAEVFRNGRRFPTGLPVAEDLVFNQALSNTGGKIYFDPTLVVTHTNRQGLKTAWSHMRYLGMGSARARRVRSDLPGNLLLRRPFLLPLLPFYRCFAVMWRLVRASPASLPSALFYSVPIFINLIAWTFGFCEGVRQEAVAQSEGARP